MKVTDKYVYFWGEFLSNWYPARFTEARDGKTLEFFNSEQYFMYEKAKAFGDEETAMRILFEGKDPKQAKSLGRKVKGYSDEVWDKMRYKVMVRANLLKYLQNKDLEKLLLNDEFEGKNFCEASPIDIVWGVGLAENDPLIDDESNWRGQNLLGKALDEVRSILKGL